MVYHFSPVMTIKLCVIDDGRDNKCRIVLVGIKSPDRERQIRSGDRF